MLRSLASPKRSDRGRRNIDEKAKFENLSAKDRHSETSGTHVNKKDQTKHPKESRERKKMAVRGGCVFLVKILLFIFNFILWAGGGCLFGYALYLRFDLELQADDGADLSGLGSFYTGLYVLMGTGGVIMVIGFLGCCGAIKENVCQLTLYFISIFIVIGAEIACGTWIYLNQDQALESVSNIIDETYTKDFKKFIDLLQTKLQCCGVHGPEDWTKQNLPVPQSCGNVTSSCADCADEIVEVGCSNRIKQYITTVAIIVGGIILLQVLVVVFSIILCRAIREAEDYDDDDKSFS